MQISETVNEFAGFFAASALNLQDHETFQTAQPDARACGITSPSRVDGPVVHSCMAPNSSCACDHTSQEMSETGKFFFSCCSGLLVYFAFRYLQTSFLQSQVDDWEDNYQKGLKKEDFDASNDLEESNEVLPVVQPKQPVQLASELSCREICEPKLECRSFKLPSECDSDESPQTPQTEPVEKPVEELSPIFLWVCQEKPSDNLKVSEAPVPARAQPSEEPKPVANFPSRTTDLAKAVRESRESIWSSKQDLSHRLLECKNEIRRGDLKKKSLKKERSRLLIGNQGPFGSIRGPGAREINRQIDEKHRSLLFSALFFCGTAIVDS
eukprot:GHVP01046703.1.p1 GENE.GHVP01046703.1~~GHVP01046703.1.p1  ORF type:complete len:333 (-),score=59.06 GHVP01046703.1:1281-2255(-)